MKRGVVSFHEGGGLEYFPIGLPGKAEGNSYITSKDAANSQFYLEKVIEESIGEYTYKHTFQSVTGLGNLLRRKMFKNCTKRISTGQEGTGSTEYKEILLSSEEFIMPIARSWVGNGMGYIIHIFTNSEKVLNKLKKVILASIDLTKKVKETGNINILVEEDRELVLKTIDKQEEWIAENYPGAFADSRTQIIEKLGGKKGIFLLHSEPGCGKTSFIKTLPDCVKNKKFIFIPPAFGNILTEPSFLTFMMGHANSVIIIEDAESILRDRKGGENHAVSNILNLTDGILSELLGIQVICTLNCNVKQIDEAIRRPGRLMWEQEFTKLSVEESNSRLLQLNPEKDYITDVPLSIAEIYNFGQVNSNVATKKALGLVGR